MKEKEGKQNRSKYGRLRTVTFWILFATLAGSIIYTAVKYINAPEDTIVEAGQRLKSDYLLMLLQCAGGLIVMFLPSIIDRRAKFTIPNYMHVLFHIFLYLAIYLGEVQNFYFRFKNWDTILHGFSACMLGALGFSIVYLFNESSKSSMQLSPVFVGLFSFCFALTVGVLWEIYEFSWDTIADMNMQKFRLETGELLAGRAALLDTMQDLLVDACGALTASLVGTISLRRGIKNSYSRKTSA